MRRDCNNIYGNIYVSATLLFVGVRSSPNCGYNLKMKPQSVLEITHRYV